MKKQYKLYELLRFHKIFENEKYFGRSIMNNNQQVGNSIFQDYYYFSTDLLKDSNKSSLAQLY
jgi:hypothetical protein